MTREEAIKEIRSWDFLEGREIEAIQTLIQELKKTDDETTRKEIIDYLKLVGKGDGDYAQPMIDRWIDWLERQKPEEDECPEYCVRSHCLGCPIYEKKKDGWGVPKINGEPVPTENAAVDITFEYLSKDKIYAIMKKLTSLGFSMPLGSKEEK